MRVCARQDPNFRSQHEEAELLFESYLNELTAIIASLETIEYSIDSTEKYVTAQLSTQRNQLLRLDVTFTVLTAALSFSSVVTGAFGMNLSSGWEEEVRAQRRTAHRAPHRRAAARRAHARPAAPRRAPPLAAQWAPWPFVIVCVLLGAVVLGATGVMVLCPQWVYSGKAPWHQRRRSLHDAHMPAEPDEASGRGLSLAKLRSVPADQTGSFFLNVPRGS